MKPTRRRTLTDAELDEQQPLIEKGETEGFGSSTEINPLDTQPHQSAADSTQEGAATAAKITSAPIVHGSYRPDIDGLRTVAVTGVVVYHFFPAVLPGGFVGVDVFFVIRAASSSRASCAGR